MPRRSADWIGVSAGHDVGHVRIQALRHAATRRRERGKRRHSRGRGGERRGAHDGDSSVEILHPLPRGQGARISAAADAAAAARRDIAPPLEGRSLHPARAENDARGLAEDTPPPRVTVWSRSGW